MSKKKKNKKTFYDIYKQQRKDWGEIKPITKVEENKKKYSRKKKHKNSLEEN